MRKLALGMALATTFLATPAIAQDRGWYAGLEAGVLKAQEIDFDYHDQLDNFDDAVVAGFGTGWDADIIGGYDFGTIRAETEIANKSASVDNLFLANVLGVTGSANSDAGSRVRATSAMGNVLLDFGEDGWRGYVGGGAGIARVKMRALNQAVAFSGSDDVLAWQLIAGFAREMTPNLELGLKYRYFRTLALALRF